MASFRLDIKPNRRAAARFVGKVRRELQAAVVADRERIGITQTKIAEAIGVHRSVVSRELNGRQDITLGRVAELAWAMGREIVFEVRVPEVEAGQNTSAAAAGIVSTPQNPNYKAFPSNESFVSIVKSTDTHLRLEL
jgi:transcriptional regulator with XRE-family HTH domain